MEANGIVPDVIDQVPITIIEVRFASSISLPNYLLKTNYQNLNESTPG